MAPSLLVAAAVLAAGCHPCHTREVRVSLAGEAGLDGARQPIALYGGASDSNVSGYERLARVLADAARPGVAQSVVFTLDAVSAPGGVEFLAVELPLPLQSGTTRPVTLAGRFGGWGTTDPGPRPQPADAPAVVFLSAAAFTPTSAQGTVAVIATAPLRIRLDVAFRDAAGRTFTLAGDVPFRVLDDTRTCSFE